MKKRHPSIARRLLSLLLMLSLLLNAGAIVGATDSDSRSAASQKQGDLRIYFHNVWGLGTNPNIANRPDLELDILKAYQPEIICFQECSDIYRGTKSGYANPPSDRLFGWIGERYTEISFKSVASNGRADHKNCWALGNPIYYRTDLFTCLDKGFKAFWNSDKGTTWAVLERKSDGERFAVLNSHFNHDVNYADDTTPLHPITGEAMPKNGNSLRIGDAINMVTVAKDIQTRYGTIPLISGGDMNAEPSREPIQILLDGGMKDVRYHTDAPSNLRHLSGEPLFDETTGEFVPRQGQTLPTLQFDNIDYIFYQGNVDIGAYQILDDPAALACSDHAPHYVDLTLSRTPSGSGTASDPYRISKAAHLAWMADHASQTAGKCFVQTCDIDLGGEAIRSIGKSTAEPFGGEYDGQGYAIANGTITPYALGSDFTPDNVTGLFGVICDAAIRNVVLRNVQVEGQNVTGGIVGRAVTSANGSNRISHCIVGSDCTVTATYPGSAEQQQEYVRDTSLDRASRVGGVVAMVSGNTTVEYCSNGARIAAPSGFAGMGGVVGSATNNTLIEHCTNSGAIYVDQTTLRAGDNTDTACGGILGSLQKPKYGDIRYHYEQPGDITLRSCYNTGRLELLQEPGNAVYFGGIAGGSIQLYPDYHYTISDCHNLNDSALSLTNVITNRIRIAGILGSYWIDKNTTRTYGSITLQDCTTVAMQSNFCAYNSDSFLRQFYNAYGRTAQPGVKDVEATNCTLLTTETDVLTVQAAICSLTAQLPALAPIGAGTEDDPYHISSAEDLRWLSDHVTMGSRPAFEGKYFVQTCDIDLQGSDLPAIGYYYGSSHDMAAFGGSYDGQGFRISNGTIVPRQNNGFFTEYYATALFGMVVDATVRNVKLDQITVRGELITGGVVGRMISTHDMASDNLVENCSLTASCVVTAAYPADITDKAALDYSNSSWLDRPTRIGGVVAAASGATIRNCVNEARIDSIGGYLARGGVVGSACNQTDISFCVNRGDIYVDLTTYSPNVISSCGGILGYLERSTIGNVFFSMDKPGAVSISSCYNEGTMFCPQLPKNVMVFGGILGSGLRVTVGHDYRVTDCVNFASPTVARIQNFFIAGIVGSHWIANGDDCGTIVISGCHTVPINDPCDYDGGDLFNIRGKNYAKSGRLAIEASDSTVRTATELRPMADEIDRSITTAGEPRHAITSVLLQAPTCTAAGRELLSCTHCGILPAAPQPVPALGHTYELGSCIRCGEEDPIVTEARDRMRVYTLSLSLRSDLTMNLYVEDEALEGVENPYLVVSKTIYDAEGNPTDVQTDELHEAVSKSGCHVYAYTGIAAREMNSTITAKVCGTVCGAAVQGTELTYTVKDYATQLLAYPYNDIALKTLLVNMLNYGAQAQTSLAYNRLHPANADLTPAQLKLVKNQTVEYGAKQGKKSYPGAVIHYTSMSVVLKNRVTINSYFSLAEYKGDVADLKLKVTIGDKTVTVPGSEFEPVGGGEYHVPISAMTAAQMRTYAIFIIYDKDGNQISDTLRYSIAAYATLIHDGYGDEPTKALVEKMMMYGDSAQDFLVG